MTSAKEEILARIRAAVERSPAPQPIDRNYRQSAPLDLQVFEDRLIDYGVRVYHCRHGELRSAIGGVLSKANKQRLLIPPGFAPEALPDGFAFERDNALPYRELDRTDGVLTPCALAIAETGTIVLRHGNEEGRRALTLIPDYHLCIVRADQVVATVPEGIRLAAQFGRAPITTISGPSATSDIEMTRVKGVHGPRTLDVLLVS